MKIAARRDHPPGRLGEVLRGHRAATAYTFLVDPRANKTEIKEAVQAIWDVRVTSVNTLKRRGKVKRRGYTKGKRADEKRAIVTLAEGDSIEIFESGK